MSTSEKHIFQDLPLIDKRVRLTVMELMNSDKQIINELVYRWCRILTREQVSQSEDVVQDRRKVLILDMIGSISPIRLATVLKRDERRMRLIGVTHGCKINSTFITLHTHIKTQASSSSTLKLIVVYQDEFYILKTLDLLKDCLQTMKCQILFIVPKLDRQGRDLLTLDSRSQILKCDFSLNRREIKPAPPGMASESYQSYLNQVFFQRYLNKSLPDRVEGELSEDGLSLRRNKTDSKQYCSLNESLCSAKRPKLDKTKG